MHCLCAIAPLREIDNRNVELPSRTAGACYRARRASFTPAAAFYFLSAAARSAAFNERFGEFAKLHIGLVRFGKFARMGLEFRRHVAQEIKEQALTVEQM